MRLSRILVAAAVLASTPALADRDAPAARPAPFVADGWSAARSISAATGGVVEIEGVARLTIPAGALPSDRVVSLLAEVVEVNGERFVAVSFSPHGTQFRAPAILELWPRVIRRAEGTPGLFYARPQEDGSLRWEALPAAESPEQGGGGRYLVEILHFSTYGVGYELGALTWSFSWSPALSLQVAR